MHFLSPLYFFFLPSSFLSISLSLYQKVSVPEPVASPDESSINLKASPMPCTSALRGYLSSHTGLARPLLRHAAHSSPETASSNTSGGSGSGSGGGGSGSGGRSSSVPCVSWDELLAWTRDQGDGSMPPDSPDADLLDFLRDAGAPIHLFVPSLFLFSLCLGCSRRHPCLSLFYLFLFLMPRAFTSTSSVYSLIFFPLPNYCVFHQRSNLGSSY